MTDLQLFLDALHNMGFTRISVESGEDMLLTSRVYLTDTARGNTDVLIGQTPRGGDDKGYMCWHFDHNEKLLEHGVWEY